MKIIKNNSKHLIVNVINAIRIIKDQKMTYAEYKNYHKFFGVERCPICGKYTFDNGYVCRICKWEADGVLEDDDEYSHANRCSINEYREMWGKQ